MKQKLTHWVMKEHKDLTLKGKGRFRHRDRRLREKFELKPVGFWLSVDNSWEDWLKGNWDVWLKGRVCVEAELADDINLFVIKSKKQFMNKYKELMGKTIKESGKGRILFDYYEFHQKLKKNYDGMMLMSGPLWAHRLDMGFMYFYPWDCESICVWNRKKIKFKEVKNEN